MSEEATMAKSGRAGVTLICGCLLWAASQGVQADIDVSIRGVIVAPPPCVINGGGSFDTPFGDDLLTTRVDGNNYRVDVNHSIVCTAPTSNDMTMELQGIGTTFEGGRFLQTGQSDLGIKLFFNGTDWPINTPMSFTHPNYPRLEAVPIKRVGSRLDDGAFSAVATLIVAYQ